MRHARIPVLFLFLLSLLPAGCKGGSYQDITVTSARIVTVVPEGLSELSALLEAEVHNPARAFELSDLAGMVRYGGQDLLELSAEPVRVEGRCDQTVRIPVRGRLAGGSNPLQLLRMIAGDGLDTSALTLSLSGRAGLRSGIGKNFELNDIPLGTLLNQPEPYADEE